MDNLINQLKKIEQDYRAGNSQMPDRMWDELMATLPPDTAGINAATQGFTMDSGVKGRVSVPLLTPAGSLSKVNSITRAKKQFERLLKLGVPISLSFKYDGAAMIQRFKLVKVINSDGKHGNTGIYNHQFDLTRGDGTTGKLVHPSAFDKSEFNRIPMVSVDWQMFDGLVDDWPEEIEIRGELYSPDSNINRSVAAGVLNRKFNNGSDGEIDSHLDFAVYAFAFGDYIVRDVHKITEYVKAQKQYHTVEMISVTSVTALEDLIRWYTKAEDDKGYIVNGVPIMIQRPIDGLVISTNLFNCKTGRTTGFYAWDAYAIKLMYGCYRTKVISLGTHTTENGNTTMNCKIDPITTKDGRKIRNLNLHNPLWYERVAKSWLYPGAEIYVTGDVIPIPVDPAEVDASRLTATNSINNNNK